MEVNFENRKEIVSNVIKGRRSVRKFDKNKLLTDEDISDLIEAGVYAPSGSNWQNQRFLIIRDKEEIDRIGKLRFVWPWISNNSEKTRDKHPAGLLGRSTCLIIVFSDSKENDRRINGEYHIWEALEIQNASASIQNILLLATAKGIGTCWVSASEKMNYTRMNSGQSWRKILKDYDIPLSYKIQGIVVCGYPARYDDDSFPQGERNHGATIWQEVKRKPNDYYLIRKKLETSKNEKLSFLKNAILFVLSKILKLNIKITKLFDLLINVIEFGRIKREDHH